MRRITLDQLRKQCVTTSIFERDTDRVIITIVQCNNHNNMLHILYFIIKSRTNNNVIFMESKRHAKNIKFSDDGGCGSGSIKYIHS